MANNLELAKIYTAELDEAIVADAVTGFMEANADDLKYNGGNEIKIPKVTMDGLGDYDRATGYAPGSITSTYETHTLTQDRGRSFMLDAMDIDETNFALEGIKRLNSFQKNHVAPEIDAYRISKIATVAIAADKAGFGYVPAVDTILSQLKNDIAEIQDVVGDSTELIVMMSRPALAVLEQADNVSRFLQADVMKKGTIETRVKSLDGIPIVAVPSSRMKTAFAFADGKTAGQESGSFTPAVGAKNVNWLVFPRFAPMGVSKTEKVRIFSPEENQDADAWRLTYRKYHDLFIADNAVAGMKISVKEAEV
jgi:hypothetical protein